MPSTDVMLREGSFALASFGRVRKVHETALAVAFGRKSVALKRILDTAFEPPSSRGEAILADLMDALLAIAFTPIDMPLCAPLFFSPYLLLLDRLRATAGQRASATSI